MRNLVTAADVKKWFDNKEKTVCLEPGTIVTPAARDAARDYGIEIIEPAAVCQRPAGERPGGPEPKGVDQLMIARIVEEVIAAMGLAKPAAYEADPCGFKLARGKCLNAGVGSSKETVCNIFGGPDCAPLSAGLLVATASRARDVKGSEIHYVLSGTVKYRINGREYTGRAGDTAFLPAGAKVSLAGAETAKIFFVVGP
jgi:ethanolamine utilization protein EutQ